MSNNSKQLPARFYILKHAKGHTMLKVEWRDIESFLDLLGDMIEGAGDSREEALTDWASGRLPGRKLGQDDTGNKAPRPGAGAARRRWWVR